MAGALVYTTALHGTHHTTIGITDGIHLGIMATIIGTITIIVV
tara:strand:+ start:113 stop:241 length:129 start_codon:yes stop_codon:yes gene_type:complete